MAAFITEGDTSISKVNHKLLHICTRFVRHTLFHPFDCFHGNMMTSASISDIIPRRSQELTHFPSGEEGTYFRFLDLPKELRFIVYEKLDISSKQCTVVEAVSDKHHLGALELAQNDIHSQPSYLASETHPSITLITDSLPIQLLATCSLINNEARPFLLPKLRKIKSAIPQITINDVVLSTSMLNGPDGLLCRILESLDDYRESRYSNYRSRQALKGVKHCERLLKWIHQTIVRLTDQATKPTSNFFGDLLHPEVRILLVVVKAWQNPPTSLVHPYMESIAHRVTALTGHSTRIITPQCAFPDDMSQPTRVPLLHTISTHTQLASVFKSTLTMARVKKLDHIKGGTIVYDEGVQKATPEGLIVNWACVLSYQVSE